MAKPIARSKSMTLKRSKRTSYLAQPLPGSDPHVLNAAAMSHNDLRSVERMPPKRADSGTASASGDEIPRPRTANSAIDRSRPLRTTGAPIQIHHEEQTFDFPTPSPEAVNHSRERLQRDQTTPIGMALGSPNQTNANAWKQSHPAPLQDANADTNSANADAANDADVPPAAHPTASDGKKPKISRWKSLFGRRPTDKPPATPAPFYQLQMPAPQTPAVPMMPARKGSHGDVIASQASLADNEKSKGGKGEEKKPRSRLRSKSSAAAEARLPPLDPPKMPTIDSDQGSPKPPAKGQSSPKKEVLKKKPSRFFGHKEPRPQITRAETSPMLNVDIPTIEMERYSVMFGSLLKGDRQSNLLLRRQGNERLKPLNSDCLRMANQSLADQDEQGEDELPKPIRRATSPATPTFQTPTLNLSLFPRDSMSGSRSNSPVPARAQSPARTQSPAPKNLNLPKPQHRLQRSFTAPASPGRPTFNFDGNDSQAEKQKPVVATNITEEPENTEEICIGVNRNDLISHAFSGSIRDSQASFESAESDDAAIRLKDSKYNNSKVDVSGWEIVSKKHPDLRVQTAVAQGAGSGLSLQSQSPLSSLSGQSVAQAKESVARQNSLREKQRRERDVTHTQSPITQPETSAAASSPRKDQRGRKPSYTSSPSSDNHQGEQARDKDAEMMLEQQRQFRERKQKQKEEQQAQQPQQNSSGPKRQPTLKERAEEVQNANRVAIARQVSISRQRAQQEMLRAQKSGGHNATNGIGSTTISSNQKNTKFTPSDHNSQSSSPTPTAPSIVVPEDEPKPKLARQESLRRAGRNAGPTTMVVSSPTGERLVERRTLTPVLVDIPNRKSVVGNIVDESDFDVALMPPPKPFALADPNRASTVSFSHLNC